MKSKEISPTPAPRILRMPIPTPQPCIVKRINKEYLKQNNYIHFSYIKYNPRDTQHINAAFSILYST